MAYSVDNDDDEQFHFDRKNYFLRFSEFMNEQEHCSMINNINKSVRHALEYFLDDLKHDRNKTVERFLNEQTVDEIFLAIAQLLTCNDERVCGNSAFIIGTTVETEKGLQQFFSIFADNRISKPVDIIQIFCQLLTHTDADCVLNSTGTLGTICGSKQGRDLVLKHVCVPQMILNTSVLLKSTNTWIASNAALVLARITVEEIGCQQILTHNKHRDILNRLLVALDATDFNRSTNIAFAVARLIEEENGKKILINDCGQNKFFEALLIMLRINDDKGMNKNACYALSCLCTSRYGFQLCLESMTIFHQILVAIETILLSTERESVWFALMCLTTIAKHHGASEHLCYSNKLLKLIKQLQEKWIDSKDIQDESKLLWFMIHKYAKPKPPKIDECRTTSVDISWEPCDLIENANEVQYRLLLDDNPILVTDQTNYSIENLQSNKNYQVKIQYVTEQGDSIPSDPTVFHTNDDSLPSVINLHVTRATMTAIRLAWEAPDLTTCHGFRGYQIYLNDVEHGFTNECGITINSLTVNTTYKIDVCLVTMQRKGPITSINAKTDSASDCFPAPPIFTVIGRRELHIKWQPPEVTCGRLSRYELLCNGRCIYSGIEQEYHATMLKPDKEYSVVVIVITNEGRFRSRPAKTRTLKDEFQNSVRPSLYEPLTQVKRAEITSRRKLSANIERTLNREITLPHQNVQITTIRSVQFKSEYPSYSRTLPGVFRNSSSTTRPTRTLQRSKTDLTAQRISATIIIPTLDINPSPRIKPYRRPTEHSACTSLPNLPYSLQRIS